MTTGELVDSATMARLSGVGHRQFVAWVDAGYLPIAHVRQEDSQVLFDRSVLAIIPTLPRFSEQRRAAPGPESTHSKTQAAHPVMPDLPEWLSLTLPKDLTLHGPSDRISGVYFIRGHGAPVKIGVAISVVGRMIALQTGQPEPLRLLAVARCQSYNVEHELHRLLRRRRMAGEWFHLSDDDLALWGLPATGPTGRELEVAARRRGERLAQRREYNRQYRERKTREYIDRRDSEEGQAAMRRSAELIDRALGFGR